MLNKIIHIGVFALLQFSCSFTTNYFITKILTPDEYGNYFLLITTAQLIATIISLGTTGAIVRFGQEMIANNTLASIMKSVYSYITLGFAIIVIAFLINSENITNLIFSQDNKWFIYILLLQIPFILQNLFASNLFWSHNNFVLRGLSQNIFFISQTIVIVSIYLTSIDVEFVQLLWVILFSRVVSFVYSHYTAKSKYKFSFILIPKISRSGENSETTKEFLSFGIWTSLSTLSLLAIDFVDRISINKFMDSESLGYYHSTLSLFTYIYLPFQLGSNVFLSFYTKDWKNNSFSVIKRIQQSTVIAVSIFIIVASFLIFYYEPVVINYYGQEYLGITNDVLIFFAFSFILKVIYSITGSLSFISNAPKLLAISYVIALIVSVPLNFNLVPIYGIKGVLITSIITQTTLLLILYCQYYANGIRFSLFYYFLIICLPIILFFVI